MVAHCPRSSAGPRQACAGAAHHSIPARAQGVCSPGSARPPARQVGDLLLLVGIKHRCALHSLIVGIVVVRDCSFDAHRVGQAMCCATFVVAAEAVVATGRQDDVAVLHAQLAARRHEVTDFCVRRYGGTGDRFVLDPRCDHDARCAQVLSRDGVDCVDRCFVTSACAK